MTKNDSKLARKSLEETLQEYDTPLVKQAKAQDQTRQETNEVTVGMDEIRESINQLKSIQEKFIYACTYGSDEVSVQLCSELLLEKQVKLDRITDKKNGAVTLMHILAAKNKPLCMELLAMHKLKIDGVDSIHSTPLFHAVSKSSTEAVAFLLSKGANVNAKDSWGKTPLMVALKAKNYQIAEMLCSEHRIDAHQRGTKGNTVLHMMAADGDLTAVKILMEKCNASPQRRNGDEENVLQVALAHPHIVQYICSKVDQAVLLKLIFNANIQGCNIVHECARNGHFDSLISVLKNVNIREYLTEEKASQLLNAFAMGDETPLMLAVKNNRMDIARFLCRCKEVRLNIGDENGNTALYHAASLKNKQAVDLLTNVGAAFKPDNISNEEPDRNVLDKCIRSLRTLLIILLAGMAFACIITIASISIGFFASTVRKDTKLINQRYFEDIVSGVLSDINAVSVAHQMSFNRVGFNVTDEEDVRATTGAAFMTSRTLLPLVSLVQCAKANSALATWIKSSTSPSVFFTSNYRNLTRSLFVIVSDFDDYLNLQKSTVRYSSTTVKGIQPYTIAAMENRDRPVWIDSFTSSGRIGELYIALTRGFRDPETDEFLGSCQYDIITRGLNRYLERSAEEQPNSVSVLIEASTGFLIGTSDVDVKVLNQTTTTTTRYRDSRGLNPRMDAMLRYGRAQFGQNFTDIGNRTAIFEEYYYNGQKQLFNVGAVRDSYGLNWVLLQSFPKRNFYDRFYNSIIVMICAAIALLLLAAILSIVIAALFMRPLTRLISQTESIKLLQLENVEKSMTADMSFFTEIYTLQHTFKSMTARLKQFRTFIPDHILAVIEEEIGVKAAEAASSRATTDNSKSHTDTATDNGAIARNIINNALNSALVSGNVTMMVIKLPDLGQLLEFHGVKEIDETSKELLSEFMDIVRISRGQFVSISGSKAVVAFNTFIKQSDHRIRACKAAQKCMQALAKLKEKWRKNNLPSLEASIAIGSDVMYYGNMGTDRMKYFTLVGSAVQRTNKIHREASKWESSVTVDQNVQETAASEFYMRPLYSVETEHGEKVVMYELGDAKPMDAWANELDEAKEDTNNKWTVYNNAYKLFEEGSYDEAYELFVEHLSKNAQDVPAQNMLGICKSSKEEIGTSGNSQTDPTATVVNIEQNPEPNTDQ